MKGSQTSCYDVTHCQFYRLMELNMGDVMPAMNICHKNTRTYTEKT